MKRIDDIRGMDVISLKSDVNLGKIRDVLIDTSSQQIIGYTISESDFFTGDKGIFIYDINTIFCDAVIIRTARTLKKIKSITRRKSNITQFEEIKNLSVTNSKGETIGNLSDLLFDPLNGHIKALVLQGNLIIPLRNQEIIIHSKSIIVSSSIKGKDQRKKSNKLF